MNFERFNKNLLKVPLIYFRSFNFLDKSFISLSLLELILVNVNPLIFIANFPFSSSTFGSSPVISLLLAYELLIC